MYIQGHQLLHTNLGIGVLFEGPFKGHAPTGQMVQFYGLGILKVDESLRAEDVEVYYDPTELFGELLKGPTISESNVEHH